MPIPIRTLSIKGTQAGGALIGISLLFCGSFQTEAATPEALQALQDARQAFQRQAYDRVLTLIEPLLKQQPVPLEARRLSVRSLVNLQRPADALNEYEALHAQAGREEFPLLREVAIGFVLPLLKDMREQMRGAAYTALKEVDSDETIPYFEGGLSDGAGLVRALAAEGLGRRPAGRRSAHLRRAVEDQAAVVRAAALKALGWSNDRTVVELALRALNDGQPVVRATAAGTLARFNHEEGVRWLHQAAGAANPEERAAALRVLGDLGNRSSLPLLQEGLRAEQPSVRGAAAAAMGDLGLVETAAALAGLLNDPVPAVRAATAVSLGELKSSDAVSALAAALRDVNPAVRAATISGLLQSGEPFAQVAEAVRDLTRNNDPAVRAMAARALGKGWEQAIIEVLQALLDDPLPRPRLAAARALGHVDDRRVIGLLKRALHDDDEAVRATAGGALARMLDPGKSNIKLQRKR